VSLIVGLAIYLGVAAPLFRWSADAHERWIDANVRKGHLEEGASSALAWRQPRKAIRSMLGVARLPTRGHAARPTPRSSTGASDVDAAARYPLVGCWRGRYLRHCDGRLRARVMVDLLTLPVLGVTAVVVALGYRYGR
jgi:hypothetical protein